MWETALPALAQGLGQGLAGAPSSAGGTSSSSFDSSGWNVNFGSGSIESKRSQEMAGNFDQYIPYVLAAVGVLIVWRLTKKR